MFLDKFREKIRPKRKIWRWVALEFFTVVFLFLIFLHASLGELSSLGVNRIVGFPGARDYLLVFQNDAERRPTGGFITSYAILKFRFGIPFISFGNVYDDKLVQKGTKPPDKIVENLLSGDFYPGHGFRDGNFDVDFPTASRELMRLYKLGYPESDFDGVIAIDFTAFANLAKTLDSSLAGAEGLFAKIENEVQGIDLHNPNEINERKNFLSAVAKSLIKKSFLHPRLASQSILASLDQEHILFYFTNPKVQEKVEAKNWGGVFPQLYAKDFLAINEGNYGGMKSSRYITRDIFYDVEFREGEDGLTPIANLRVNLEHRGDAAEPISGYYKGYWRIFTPLGAEKVKGDFEAEFDDGYHQVYGKVIKMNPGESREIALRYELSPHIVEDGVYKLKLVKQSGSGDDFTRVSLKLPNGYLFADSEDFEVKENLAIYQTLLDSDKDLEIKILKDTTPPRLSWQEFRGGLNEIDLRFNEPLDAESVQNAKFEIRDLNYRNERTDDVKITRVKFVPPQNIRLTLQGVSEECREWYELNIDGVGDLRGNILQNHKITVVEWLDARGEICDKNREL